MKLTHSLVLGLYLLPAIANAEGLFISIEGIRSADGYLMLAASSREEYHGKTSGCSIQLRHGAVKGHVRLSLEVPANKMIALKVYHDENANNKLDTGLFARPLEGYGFSNNATTRFGIPNFDKAAFSVEDQPSTKQLSITLNY
ncbi:MAG: DUF2141 domain-containing protein [Candidatus Thiodiazotropha endolucinida]